MEAERVQCKTEICSGGSREQNEAFETDNVESKWNAMKQIWQKAAEQVCQWTKRPPRHSETWRWNEQVAEAIEEKRRHHKIWHKSKEQVIGISIRRQDEMQEVLLFYLLYLLLNSSDGNDVKSNKFYSLDYLQL